MQERMTQLPNGAMTSGLTRAEYQRNHKRALEEEIRDGVNYIDVEAFVSGTDEFALPDMVDIKVKGMFPSQARRLVAFLKSEAL